ncbi:MAG: hypothetical protein IPH84_18820 [Bacteroidales bacterium]|nr:hypothetical protein [Bacteroidales bacterium]
MHFDGNSWSAQMIPGNYYLENCSFSDAEHGILSSFDFDGDVLLDYNYGSINPLLGSTRIRSMYMVDSITGYASEEAVFFMLVIPDATYISMSPVTGFWIQSWQHPSMLSMEMLTECGQ